MYPPIFAVAKAASGVTALLGTNPTRFYPFGEAPQDVTKPYATWQTVSGSPENYINQTPDLDSWTVQVDVYADSATSARAVAQALRDALEPVAHVVSWGGEDRDRETKNYHYSFDVEFMTSR